MFNDLTPADARGYVSAPPDLDANRRFVGAPTAADPDARADHWQDGAGYTGPLPATTSSAASDVAYIETLKGTFVAEDCLSDVLQRKRNGVLGKAPAWSFEPDRDDAPEAPPASGAEAPGDRTEDPEKAAADAVTEAMRAWAPTAGGSGVDMASVLKRWLDSMGYAGRGYLRVFVPRGRYTTAEDGSMSLSVSTPEEALRHIYAEALDADQAAIYTDRDEMAHVGIVAFAPETETIHADDADTTTDADVELSYLESTADGARTIVRTYAAGATDPAEGAIDLGGRITLHEGRLRPLLDTGAVSNQRDLNTLRTMIAINGHKAGFPKLFFIGVQPPTRTVSDGEGGFIEEAYAPEIGPGHQGFYTTQPVYDADGRVSGTETGSVTEVGPADNGNLRQDAQVAREAIYRSARQSHALALAGANLSGEAMIQAQGEYLADLTDAAAEVSEGGRWLLEVVWRMACGLAETPERASGVRAVFECRPQAGPLSSAMRQEIIRQYEAGLLSAETAMSLLGVDDIDAERERMEAEAQTTTARRAAEGAALFGLAASGATASRATASGDGAATDPDRLDPQITPEAASPEAASPEA